MNTKNNLSERLLKFAVDLPDYVIQAGVILYLRTVKNTIETMDMKHQLVKALPTLGLGSWNLEFWILTVIR